MPGYLWTEDEKNLLKELTGRGHGAIRIRRLGHFARTHDGRARTVDAIAQQIRRMKLANAQASARSRRATIAPAILSPFFAEKECDTKGNIGSFSSNRTKPDDNIALG
jgi:hypothetical protein